MDKTKTQYSTKTKELAIKYYLKIKHHNKKFPKYSISILELSEDG